MSEGGGGGGRVACQILQFNVYIACLRCKGMPPVYF